MGALSSAQLAACRQHGLEVYLEDAREIDRERFGMFDAVASLGAFEHFCSPADYQAGRQEEIYRDLFARVSSLLPPGGRFYLQTMVFGHNMIPASRIDLEALRGVPPRGSDEWYIALLRRQFPGSWLPFGQEQVIRCAEPHFRMVSSVSGRLDYIETINRWNARVRAPSFRKRLLKLRLLPRWLISADFRLAFSSGVSANQVCFQRELLDHYRLVFENQKVWRDGKSRALHSARRAAVLPHADSGAHENACGRARYRCSRRRLSADTTLVRSSDRGERDRAAAMVLTIQIVATRSRGLSGPGDRDLAEAVAPARVVLR